MSIAKIVVGTDGSEHAAEAMLWAAREADLHRASLEVVLAWGYLDQHHADGPKEFDPAYTEHDAQQALAAWVTAALGPDARARQRVILDVPARALLEAGDDADLLVVGARGTGGFEGLLLGSVSERVAQNTARPVAVVRSATADRHRVVVGIDGSARSLSALRWAAAEARVRGTGLDVVHAWQLPAMAAPAAVAVAPHHDLLHQGAREVLDRALSDPALADLDVAPVLVEGGAARALVERAARADLVVVGTRGRGRISGALMGSVSRQLLAHAPCPVVVI